MIFFRQIKIRKTRSNLLIDKKLRPAQNQSEFFILSVLCGDPFLRNNPAPYKNHAGGVLAVDISVTYIYIVSLGEV